ncbi:MAG: 1,4-alpha-glucan branching protein [Candidatus Margulisbacteria bacterium GWF2_35_9]|nr:MAG: 1,4-alpha-glucan branching protein [Candidatus Margulisbacteria bacterium GWF2_35_9]
MTTSQLFQDSSLSAYFDRLLQRNGHFNVFEKHLVGDHQSLPDFANAHQYFGLHKTHDGWVFREWAPNAEKIFLVGSFNQWKEDPKFQLEKINNDGVWEVKLPTDSLQHLDQYKLKLYWENGIGERIPAYSKRVVQDPSSVLFNAQVWEPNTPYIWNTKSFQMDKTVAPLIYEAHVGMAQELSNIGSYKQFTDHILPMIKESGYNTIQLMAIIEHPYYASFGYHVANFFAVSSRYGTPEEFKELVDKAHGMGISVVLDLVHSHTVKNENEGLSLFDGTPFQYFHDGPRGNHAAWDSRCFDYAKPNVLHFLLSNCKYLMEEYKIDGFRFDGVTSMMYQDHGLNRVFTSYDDYFGDNVDNDAITYLMLANKLIHEINPNAITIAEDVSGMPGLAFPINEGGMGFDYRMAMGVTDYWFKMLKEIPDEKWNMEALWNRLTDKRSEESTISYVECHDQAMVGGQSLSHELAGKSIYSKMNKSSKSIKIERMIALHKMSRLITLGSSGNGYLNFMGNEFGHPEWIDFPREGNNWSYHYARRLWSLKFNSDLKYQYLDAFDKAFINLEKTTPFIRSSKPELWHIHEDNKIIAFRRNQILFIFNFNSSKSFSDYPINVLGSGEYQLLLDSDKKEFGGFGRIDENQSYFTSITQKNYFPSIQIYIPNRTALVLIQKQP